MFVYALLVCVCRYHGRVGAARSDGTSSDKETRPWLEVSMQRKQRPVHLVVHSVPCAPYCLQSMCWTMRACAAMCYVLCMQVHANACQNASKTDQNCAMRASLHAMYLLALARVCGCSICSLWNPASSQVCSQLYERARHGARSSRRQYRDIALRTPSKGAR